jgi:hypothetical protein
MNANEQEQELDARLAALTRESEPEPAVWAAIEQRLQRPRRWLAPVSAVAGVLLCGLLIGLPPLQHDATRSPGQLAIQTMREAAPGPQAIAEVSTTPALADAWQENQAVVRELEQALQAEPDNPLLIEFLVDARLRETRLVQLTQRHNRSNSS